MTEVKILTQTMMLCQPKQHESGEKKGKVLHVEMCQDSIFWEKDNWTLKWCGLHYIFSDQPVHW